MIKAFSPVRKLVLSLGILAAGMSVWAQPPANNPMNIVPPSNQTGVNPATSKGGNATGSGAFNKSPMVTGGGSFTTDGSGNTVAPDGTPSLLNSPLAKSSTITEHTVKYANTITASDLHAHLSFLASAELEGRETAKRGQKVAARYLASQFAKFGLKPGNNGKWYQEFELEEVSIKDMKISLDGKKDLQRGTDFVHFSKFGLSDPSTHSMIFAGYAVSDAQYDNLDGIDVKGKAAIFLGGEPMRDGKYVLSNSDQPSKWGKEINLKLDALRKAGATMAVSVVTDAKFEEYASNPWVKHRMEGSGLKLAYQETDGLPWIIMPEKHFGAYLKKSGYTFESLKKTLGSKDDSPVIQFGKAALELKPDAIAVKTVSENVLGYLEGTDKKDEVIVITAHYDHLGIQDGQIHFGADDDGSGTAALLELAEAFALAAQNGHRPRRSILFMPVSGEEKGLLGSEYYSDHPVYPLKKTVCNLNIDMIGRLDEAHEKDSNYVYIIGSDMLSTDMHRANEVANTLVTQIRLDYTYNKVDDPNQYYYRSDHYNFAKHDIPVIFYFTGVHEDYHKPTDVIEKVMFGKAAKITQLVFTTAWEAANREAKLVVDKKAPAGSRR